MMFQFTRLTSMQATWVQFPHMDGANVSVKWLSVMCPVIDWRLFQGMFCLSSDVRWARLEFTVTLNSIGGEENEIALPHYCQFCCRSPAPPNRMWMASCRGHLILGLHRLLLCLGHKGPCCALPRRRISALGHLPSPFCFLHLFISLGFKCVIAGGVIWFGNYILVLLCKCWHWPKLITGRVGIWF